MEQDNTKKYLKLSDIPEMDRKAIEGIPWAEQMWTTLESGLNKAFLKWCEIVINTGEKGESLNQWVNIFINAHEQTCCDLVEDMQCMQANIVDKIENLLQKCQYLCKTLQIEMPVCGNKQLSLYQERELLERHIEEYEKIVEVRAAELNKLRNKQSELCNNLGMEPKILRDSPLPSREEIEEFERYIDGLESEKFNRLEKFILVKGEIMSIINELKIQPTSNFEREVCSLEDSEFKVTNDNMKKLDQLYRSLQKQCKNVKEEIEQLRLKIDDLWKMLEVDLQERDAFQQKYKGNSVDVLEALRVEVKRCEELKKANIKVFIDKLRDELVQMWGKCHCSANMRQDFGFFYSDCYNQDLLELHEVEHSKWKKYYEENKELLMLLEKHKYLWNKMIELEENAMGPDRYNNRGGQLLKEEKERNTLAKKIPQIEEKLEMLANRYMQRHDIPFTTYGETVREYIANLHDDRENAKKQKLSARKMHKEQTMLTPAKSALSLFPSTSNIKSATPLVRSKRKLCTPLIDSKKKAKVVLTENRSNKVGKTPVPIIKITNDTVRAKRLSTERKKRLQKIRRLSAQKTRRNPNETFSTDYGDFQTELSSRDDCRSTIIPGDVLSTPKSTSSLRPKHPTLLSRTPRTPYTPRGKANDEQNKLSTAKSQLKLIF